MTSTVETIKIEVIDSIALLRMDRPPANAIDLEMAAEFETTLASIESRDEIHAVVITGDGNCFSAGLDLKLVPAYDRAQQQEMVMRVNRLFGRLYALQRPTIAAVNGHAIAGGVILTLACDYRIGAEGDYKLGLAEIRVGVPFPVAAITIVQSELTKPVARKMVLTGRNSSPSEALAFGVLDELHSPEALMPRAMEVAHEMAALPRDHYRRTKKQLRAEAFARISVAIDNRNEPMLESWLSGETTAGAAQALKREN
jgi:enoyl-CoA hydratase